MGIRDTGKLTVAKIQALTKPGMYGDGGTLFLRVARGGSKSWIQRLAIDGKRRDIGLGGWPLTTLTEAREAAFENRRLARRGGDPLAAKRKARVPTFRAAAEATFEANRPCWRNTKVATNWLRDDKDPENAMNDDRLLRRDEVESRCGLVRSSIYRVMRAGQFPEPVKVGQRAVRWPERELEKWLAERPRATGEVAT